LSGATALAAIIALVAAFAEWRDIPADESNVARLDFMAVAGAALVYIATTALRVIDTGAAAPSPLAFLPGVAGLLVLLVGSAMASVLYAGREWEEMEEIVPERRRRRVVGR